MVNVTEYFGCDVFGDEVMKQRLPEDIYLKLKESGKGKALDRSIADVVANAMKDWAIEKGATHYTHWFQPMTGITAEKHDSFITPSGDGGIIMEFSGKELIKGETDGSSLPNGGLRVTFEARGYTAWDPTSYAFVKDGSLCIPTAFCSYGGESLDKKTPLLRSMHAINESAVRFINLFGHNDIKTVSPTVGAEQEYFLIDRKLCEARDDLCFCGRTLFGAMPPKGQEMNDHYCGAIRPRVSAFMKDLDCELWKQGILSKTKHNEAAPAQHEMAPLFTTVNIAADHNQLTMEIMKKVAERHGLICLLHEKPFLGVNGSGKHNNWSLSTDTGANLLNPGKTPSENKQFLLILCAVIAAVNRHQDLLRISVASASNDHRLGAHEAPPAIVSMFLGEELENILESIEKSTVYEEKGKEKMDIGAGFLPRISRDNTDRNRTSPFAFTGNKFEFRMLGSSDSIACTNTILNTIVADVFDEFYEKLKDAEDFDTAVYNLIRETYKENKRIVFNGDGYSKEWEEEAERRGLLNYRDSATALSHYADKKNVELFGRHGVYTETELRSRSLALTENYGKVLMIEGKTALSMLRQQILPAFNNYTAVLCENLVKKANASEFFNFSSKRHKSLSSDDFAAKTAAKLSRLSDEIYSGTEQLKKALLSAEEISDAYEKAYYCRDNLLTLLGTIRKSVDEGEAILAEDYLPFPTYRDLLFGV